MTEETSPLAEVPAVSAYLKRVGATFTSLFRASVTRSVGGYNKETGVIHFNRSGEIFANGISTPTDAEREIIAHAISELRLPESVRLAALDNSSAPDDIRYAPESHLFKFRDREGSYSMVQVRVDLPNGDKRYVPYTFWSDGKWRRCEPDGLLPIYGLFEAVGSSRIFIHEGAKAAKAAQAAASDVSHPWYAYLSTGGHVGWIGGIHQVGRNAWGELATLSPDDVIIVPDNDAGGGRTVPKVSRRFRCRTSVVIWDDEWPQKFDLADPLPKHYFANGVYVGPNMDELLFPAEWVTDMIPNPSGQGRPVAVARESFLDRWYRVERTKTFSPQDNPMRQLDTTNFNAYMRPFSDVADIASLFSRYMGPVIEQPTFAPDKRQRVLRDGGQMYLNQYVDLRIRSVPGDTEPFDSFMKYLITDDKDRENLLRWLCTLFSRPDIRMGYAVLLLSERQGVGKSTLGQILARMIGKPQVSFPGDAMIAQSDFNGWLVNKRLVVVNEIYAGQNWKVYNKLKSLVTDPEIDANIKHMATYTIPNWVHFFCCSNSKEALRIEDDDRRWLVPQVTEELWGDENYNRLYSWMAGGGLRHLAHRWLNESDYERAGGRAPGSAAKLALVENSRPPEHEFVSALIQRLEPNTWLDLSDAWVWLRDRLRSQYLTPQRVSNIARREGYGVTSQHRVNGHRRRFLCVSQDVAARFNGMSSEEIEAGLLNPERVWNSAEPM